MFRAASNGEQSLDRFIELTDRLPVDGDALFVGPGFHTATLGFGSQPRVQSASGLIVGTIEAIADQLSSGFWNGDAHHWAVSQGGTLTVDISALNPTDQGMARDALAIWTQITGVFFQPVTGGAQITFDDSDDAGLVAETSSAWSNGIMTSAHVHISNSWMMDYGSGRNSYTFQTYIHEVGHALGLGHPGNYNETATYPDDALFANDSWAVSVMSYFSQTDNSYVAGQGFGEAFDNTPMMADILAIQHLYGLSTTSMSGDTTWTFSTHSGAYCIFDAGGTDLLWAAGSWVDQLINLNPGTFSNLDGNVGNVSIAIGTIIENATGGRRDDTIIGNDVANELIGSEGSDTLIGGAGDDILWGDGTGASRPGSDVMTGGPGHDTFIDTKANLNGDTITDFERGDRIVIVDANIAAFSMTLTGHTLSYTGGSLTLTSLPAGRIVASAAPGGGVQLTVDPRFGPGTLAIGAFGYSADAGGWQSQDHYPRAVADVNGDGRADIIGFGEAGVYVALAQSGGGFAPSFLASSEFGAGAGAGGWVSNSRDPRILADVNGDHRADVVGFGENGVYVALGRADGTFGSSTLAVSQFGASASAGGWASNDRFPRMLADVNGDGRADIVGFGEGGVYVSLANADGTFAPANLTSAQFGAGSNAGGWASQDRYPRMLADVNGDHRADIVGFGEGGVFVSLANADGTFAPARLASTEFGAGSGAGGWASNDHFVRELADVNGDGRADIIGFGNDGVFIAFGRGDGTFESSILDINAFGAGPDGGNWSTQDSYPRLIADVNHDGAADIVGFGSAGAYASLSNGDIWH